MKEYMTALLVGCIALCGYAPMRAAADTPRMGDLQIAVTTSNVTVGEPLILKYKITNPEANLLDVNVDSNVPKWLDMSLIDAAGRSVHFVPDADRLMRHGGVSVSPGSSYTGYFVVSQQLQPRHSGRYTLKVLVHLISSWPNHTDENSVTDEAYYLPITVGSRNPQRLQATAESFRYSVLHDRDFGKRQAAIKALFSMRDPESLPVWRELALDPNLDAFDATEVIHQLAKVASVNASDVLAEMDQVSPDRWSRTGTSPLVELEHMQGIANPELKLHINELLGESDASPDQKHYGSAN